MLFRAALLALALVRVAAQGGNPHHQKGPESGVAADLCQEMCQNAENIGECLTECRVHTDSHPDMQGGVKNMVEDQTVNEQGGEAMERQFEATTGEKVASCVPEFEGEPTFDQVDEDSSGAISADEAIDMAHKMCVPDEMAMQIFVDADADANKELSQEEYEHSGEDTAIEAEVDAVADQKGGDDQHHEVQVPTFEDWDVDGNGVLDEDEMMEVLAFALSARGFDVKAEASMSQSEEELEQLQSFVAEELETLMIELDTNQDGVIDKSEFSEEAEGTLGDELGEAQDADLSSAASDPTDPATVSSVSSTDAPAFFLRVQRHDAKARLHRQHRHAHDGRGTRPAGLRIRRRAAAHAASRHRQPAKKSRMARRLHAASRHASVPGHAASW